MKLRSQFILITSLLIAAMIPMSLGDTKQVNDLRILEIKEESITDGEVQLRITGLCISSSKVVKRTLVSRDSEEIHLQVVTGLNFPKNPNLTARFEVVIPVPAAVRKVTFGQERIEIWQRNAVN